MNRLSRGVRAMLGRQTRRQTIRKREAIIQELIRAGLPVFEPVVAFQAEYGGIEYMPRSGGYGFSFDLFLALGPSEIRTIAGAEDSQGYWSFRCGDVPSAPFHFDIRQDGAICADLRINGLLPVATSVEKYIESDAMRDGLMDVQEKWWEFSFDIAGTDRSVDAVLTAGRTVVAIASDVYTTWWVDAQSRISRYRIWGADAGDGVTAYLPSRDAAIQLAHAVSPILGRVPEVFSYPYDVEEHHASYRREQRRKRNSFIGKSM